MGRGANASRHCNAIKIVTGTDIRDLPDTLLQNWICRTNDYISLPAQKTWTDQSAYGGNSGDPSAVPKQQESHRHFGAVQ